MLSALAVLVLLGAAALGVAAAARWLDRPVPAAALAGFLLLSMAPYPLAFVTARTPLPLDHVLYVPPWYRPGTPPPRNPYLNDITTQILPWTEAVRLAWKEGSLPLRDRWNGCGTPLAANSVSAAFSPLTFAIVALPLWRGFTLAIAVKLFAAAAGLWLWMRELGLSKSASAYGSVAFALSFSFLPPWILYPQSGVFCLWPWVLFLLERCRDTRHRERTRTALTALFVLIVLAGHPESAALGFLFAGLWLLGRRLRGDLPDLAAVAKTAAPAAIVAVGLAAFLLIPSALAIAASGRLAIAKTPYWQPHLSLTPHAPQWRGILPAFFPHTLGNAIHSPTIPGGTGTFPEMAMGYAGILTWMAALLVFRPGSPRPRSEGVLWIIALVGFGQAVCLWPIAETFARVPLYRYVFPLRFNSWMALALPAIAALELDRLLRDRRDGRAGALAAGVSSAVLGAAGAGLYAYLYRYRRIEGSLSFHAKELAVVLGILALAAVLVAGARAETFAAGLTLLCGAELLGQWRIVNRVYSPALLFPETPLIGFLRSQPGTFRVAGRGSMLFPSTNVFARLEEVRTHDALERHDYMTFLDATCGYPYGDYFKMLGNLDASALDFLNVRYVLDAPRTEPPGARWRVAYSGEDGTAFENTRVLPRAFAPARVRRIAPPPARPWPVLDAASTFGPTAFKEIAALQDWREVAYVLAEGGGEIANARVEISGYAESTNRVDFDVRVEEGAGGAFVVLSLIQDGGWSARDETGAALPTFLANGPFLAVSVPAGSRRVHLRYEPPGWRVGGFATLAMAGLVGASALARRARRRP